MIIRSVVVLAVLAAGHGSAMAQSWPADRFNPKPSQGDVILPAPCGGAITMRRVVTGRSGGPDVLNDKKIELGSMASSTRGYLEFQRTEYLAGPFEQGAERFYLIGKYEITGAQFDAVMLGSASNCPAPPSGRAAVLPKTGVSWFDAVEFTRRYSSWLLKNAANALPSGPGGKGFIRLPSEAEWEFAARGGLAVGDSERSSDLFPLNNAPLANFAWFSTPEMGNEPQPIGAKRANPLDLYDVLGNVHEIMLEPLRLNKVGRLHGQVGGYVVRGGSIKTEQADLTLAARDEYPYFTAEGESRRPDVGFRIVAGGAATGDFNYTRKLEQAFADATRSSAPKAEQARINLAELALKARDEKLRASMKEVQAQIQLEVARRNELEVRAAKSILMSAVTIRNELQKSVVSVKVYDGEAEADRDPSKKADWKQRADANVQQFQKFGSAYADLIKQLSDDFALRVDTASGDLAAELRARGQEPAFKPLLDGVLTQIAVYQKGQQRDLRSILRAVAGEGRWLP